MLDASSLAYVAKGECEVLGSELHIVERVEFAQLLINLSTLDGVVVFLVEDLSGGRGVLLVIVSFR